MQSVYAEYLIEKSAFDPAALSLMAAHGPDLGGLVGHGLSSAKFHAAGLKATASHLASTLPTRIGHGLSALSQNPSFVGGLTDMGGAIARHPNVAPHLAEMARQGDAVRETITHKVVDGILSQAHPHIERMASPHGVGEIMASPGAREALDHHLSGAMSPHTMISGAFDSLMGRTKRSAHDRYLEKLALVSNNASDSPSGGPPAKTAPILRPAFEVPPVSQWGTHVPATEHMPALHSGKPLAPSIAHMLTKHAIMAPLTLGGVASAGTVIGVPAAAKHWAAIEAMMRGLGQHEETAETSVLRPAMEALAKQAAFNMFGQDRTTPAAYTDPALAAKIVRTKAGLSRAKLMYGASFKKLAPHEQDAILEAHDRYHSTLEDAARSGYGGPQ